MDGSSEAFDALDFNQAVDSGRYLYIIQPYGRKSKASKNVYLQLIPSSSIMKATNIDAKNQPRGNPICRMPVKSPLNLGGEDSVTVVKVMGD